MDLDSQQNNNPGATIESLDIIVGDPVYGGPTNFDGTPESECRDPASGYYPVTTRMEISFPLVTCYTPECIILNPLEGIGDAVINEDGNRIKECPASGIAYSHIHREVLINPPAPPPSPVLLTTMTTTISRDPHLVLAHGGRADFKGEDGKVYNLLSARNLSFNALFKYDDFNLPHRLVHGSYMQSVFVTARTSCDSPVACKSWSGRSRLLHIEFNSTKGLHKTHFALVREQGRPSVQIDSKGMRFDNVFVQLREHQKATSLYVNTGKWKLSAVSKNFPNPDENPGKMLLHVGVEALYDADSDPVAPHGLIGQSYDGDGVAIDGKQDDYRNSGDVMSTEAQAEGAIEGAGADYIMSSEPFATDFKYSRFNAVKADHRDVSLLKGSKRVRSNHVGSAGTTTFAAEDVPVTTEPTIANFDFQRVINRIHPQK